MGYKTSPSSEIQVSRKMAEATKMALSKATELRAIINEALKNEDKATLALKAVAITLAASKLNEIVYHHDKHFTDRVQAWFYQFVRSLPGIGEKIQLQVDEAKATVHNQKSLYNPKYIMQLPEKSSSVDEMIEKVEFYLKMDTIPWREGKVQGAVYDNDEEIIQISAKAYEMFMWSNPLHADVFKVVRKMEAECIAMVLDLYNSPESGCGLFTSGGTESIGLACLAARNKALKNGIKWPELVMPTTAHSAFDKACDYFRIKLIRIPVDPVTYRVKVKNVKSAINSNTCMIVGSAPTYPHGAYDDIAAMSELALKYGVLMHVDSLTSVTPASPRSRATRTSTATAPKAPRSSCSVRQSCGDTPSSRVPSGPAEFTRRQPMPARDLAQTLPSLGQP